eukprot:1187579-Prorocentrum_minimum.AAC.2
MFFEAANRRSDRAEYSPRRPIAEGDRADYSHSEQGVDGRTETRRVGASERERSSVQKGAIWCPKVSNRVSESKQSKLLFLDAPLPRSSRLRHGARERDRQAERSYRLAEWAAMLAGGGKLAEAPHGAHKFVAQPLLAAGRLPGPAHLPRAYPRGRPPT